jgi:hypothetical protein
MKRINIIFGAAILLGIAIVLALNQRPNQLSSVESDQQRIGSDAHTDRDTPRVRSVRNSSLDRITRAKFDKFISLVSTKGADSNELTQLLAGIPLSPNKINLLISEMGREKTIQYLEGLNGQIHDSDASSIIYNKFIEDEISSDYVKSIEVIRRIGVSALQSENFSSLIGRAILAGDKNSLELISRDLIAKEFWPLRVRDTLLDAILKEHESYEKSFAAINEIDPSGQITLNLAIEHFKDDSNLIDLKSNDGLFILKYLSSKDFLDKDVFISDFIQRNSKPTKRNSR